MINNLVLGSMIGTCKNGLVEKVSKKLILAATNGFTQTVCLFIQDLA